MSGDTTDTPANDDNLIIAWLERYADRLMTQGKSGGGGFFYFIRIGDQEPFNWGEAAFKDLRTAVRWGIEERKRAAAARVAEEVQSADQVRGEPRKPGGTKPPPPWN